VTICLGGIHLSFKIVYVQNSERHTLKMALNVLIVGAGIGGLVRCNE